MAVIGYQKEQVIMFIPTLGFSTFVAKLQKAKTRKDKDYFVLRTTIPKSIAEEMKAGAGEYIFVKAKKAEWYHMLDWKEMKNTWQMLPNNIKKKVIMDGVTVPSGHYQIPMREDSYMELGSASPTLATTVPEEQTSICNP